MALLSALLSIAPLLFSAVPPSTNPSSKLNKQFLLQVEDTLLAEILEVKANRIRFSPSFESPPFHRWSALLCTGVQSIRIVALERSGILESNGEQEIADLIDPVEIFSSPSWLSVSNSTLPGDRTFRIRCKKYQGFACPDVSTRSVSTALRSKLTREFGWVATEKNADVELHVLLEGSRLVVEIPILVRPRSAEELPKPGFKRVESFALVKAAKIQPGDVVLDPMCGRGTFLIEGATCWSYGTYLGLDSSEMQLSYAHKNVEATCVKVELRHGDACHLVGIPSGSIDKIVSCPPFGRQFGSPNEIPDLYNHLLQEWSRVLKESGKMALLVDTSNIENMLGAIDMAACHAEFIRDSFRLGKIRATIMIVNKGAASSPVRTGFFDWEVGPRRDRALWASLRSAALPSLIPFSSMITS